MVKYLQIFFLWFAGTLILAHQFVPHHHHKAENASCEIERSIEAHSHHSEISDSQGCNCDHSNNETDCELNLKSIDKQSVSNKIVIVACNLITASPTNEIEINIHTTDDQLIHHLYLFEYSRRGPPQLS